MAHIPTIFIHCLPGHNPVTLKMDEAHSFWKACVSLRTYTVKSLGKYYLQKYNFEQK